MTATLTLSNAAAGALFSSKSGTASEMIWWLEVRRVAFRSIADVNALLAGVTFNPAANFNGSFTIATSVSDGVAAAITGSKAITGIAVNDPPTATNLNASETYTEDTPLNLTDIVVSDIDSATVTATLTLSNVAAGPLTTPPPGAGAPALPAGTRGGRGGQRPADGDQSERTGELGRGHAAEPDRHRGVGHGRGGREGDADAGEGGGGRSGHRHVGGGDLDLHGGYRGVDGVRRDCRR